MKLNGCYYCLLALPIAIVVVPLIILDEVQSYSIHDLHKEQRILRRLNHPFITTSNGKEEAAKIFTRDTTNTQQYSNNNNHNDILRMMPSQTPMVPYKAPGSQYTQFVSIEAAMYKDRTMMINKYIDENVANNIIAILLYLRNESPREKISLYFNVPGGELRPSLAIYDLIQNTKKNCIIETVNLALCAGMGSILCSAGTKGYRSAMPNARFLLQRIGMDNVFQGQATDIALEVKNVKLWNDQMQKEIATLTGQDIETIQKDMARDFYLIADEAVQYGLIDRVLLPSIRKRSARNTNADLGNFDMDNIQKYQMKQDGTGGWGSSNSQNYDQRQPPSSQPPNRKKPKDDRYDDDGNPNVE